MPGCPIDQYSFREIIKKGTAFKDGDTIIIVYTLGFARAGWTEASQHFAQAFASHPSSGPNWQGVTIQLLDLTRVDADLCKWAENGGDQ